MPRMTGDRVLGLVCLAGGALLLAVWIPLDVETGIAETVRRRVVLGDSLAPTAAGVVILLAGLLLTFGPGEGEDGLARDHLRYLASVGGVLVLSLLVMRHAGPAIAGLAGLMDPGLGDYRALRDTAPWKHLGLALGGTGMVAGLIGVIEGRLSLSAVLVALAAVAGIVAVFDLPFDDLLLPPNGDV